MKTRVVAMAKRINFQFEFLEFDRGIHRCKISISRTFSWFFIHREAFQAVDSGPEDPIREIFDFLIF